MPKRIVGEYMSMGETKVPDVGVPMENTLFTEALFEHIADNLSKDEAYRAIGIMPPEEIPATVEAKGAAVELGAHAVAAVTNIMKTYNQLNKTRGARAQREKMSGASINTSYAHPDSVIEGMGRKAAKFIHENDADFDSLNNTAGMIEAGFTPAEAERQKSDLRKHLLNKFGPGKAGWEDRRKFSSHAARSAKIAERVRASSESSTR